MTKGKKLEDLQPYIIDIEYGTPAYDETVQLRQEVLMEPLGLRLSMEELMNEYAEKHVVCYSGEGSLLGCLVLVDDGEKGSLRIKQVAVGAALQRLGVGTLMMHYCEDHLKKVGYNKLVLHAKSDSVRFYERKGFKTTGKSFLEAKVKHHRMEKECK